MFCYGMQSWDMDPEDQSASHDMWEIASIINKVIAYSMSTNEQQSLHH